MERVWTFWGSRSDTIRIGSGVIDCWTRNPARLASTFSTLDDLAPGRMPRMIAARYALTMATDDDVSTHLATVWEGLQDYEIMTGSFVNFYAPEGWGGVMTCNPWQGGPDFHHLRL